jgi:hypothetical protein
MDDARRSTPGAKFGSGKDGEQDRHSHHQEYPGVEVPTANVIGAHVPVFRRGPEPERTAGIAVDKPQLAVAAAPQTATHRVADTLQ